MRVALLVVASALASGSAAAQDCAPGAPDLYPADGSSGLPLDGVVRVVFHEPYEIDAPVEEALVLFDESTGEEVPGDVRVEPQAGGDTRVELLTLAPLSASTSYRATVLLPLGGGEQTFAFRTGSVLQDAAPPEFEGASSILVVPAEAVPCGAFADEGEDPGDGYRVTVSFPPATDESGPANMDFILYQTLGPDIELPIERKRVRAFGTNPFGAVFLPEDAVDNEVVCFVVHAVDMFGNVASPEREACGDPVGPGQFRSMCGVAPGGLSSPAGPIVFGLLAAVLAYRRRLDGARSFSRRRRSRRRCARRPPP